MLLLSMKMKLFSLHNSFNNSLEGRHAMSENSHTKQFVHSKDAEDRSQTSDDNSRDVQHHQNERQRQPLGDNSSLNVSTQFILQGFQ